MQKDNIKEVNSALNEMYVLDEDYNALKESIDTYDAFDQLELAQSIEKHVLLEFRRIAAYVYKKNKRYSQSIALSKQDKMYKDAIDTAADSAEQELAEDLLSFFVTAGDKECFAAALFTCSHLVRPDVVMEIAWRNKLSESTILYLAGAFFSPSFFSYALLTICVVCCPLSFSCSLFSISLQWTLRSRILSNTCAMLRSFSKQSMSVPHPKWRLPSRRPTRTK